jgi:hypothetical protein
LRERTRARLSTRLGLDPAANEPELRAAARRAGYADDEVDAVLGSAPDSEAALLALGRAAAHLEMDA